SSIAKGYGVDEIATVLDQHQVAHYLVEIGGELRARGNNERHVPWTVSIEMPTMTDASRLRKMPPALPAFLIDRSIATSGDYRRCFEHGGQRYAHTLDPATGYPTRHRLASVSVLHAQCMMADALATALFS